MDPDTYIPNFESDLPTYFPVHSSLRVKTEFANILLLGQIDDRLHKIKKNAEDYLSYTIANPHLLRDKNCLVFLEIQLEAFVKLLLAKHKLQTLQLSLKSAHRDLVDGRRHEQDLDLDNYRIYKDVTKTNFADKIVSDLDEMFERSSNNAILRADSSFQYLKNARFVLENPEDPLPDDQKDEDVAVAGGKISLKDPLSLNFFAHPVISKKCSHVFEKEHIFRLMEGHSQIHCPVTGCSAHLAPNDLQEDKLMALRVKVYLAKERQQPSAIRI